MLKRFAIFALLGCAISARAFETLSPDKVNQISAAIYKIEGGNHTKYPFGIRSIDTSGNVDKAKIICQNTIRNNFVRWQKAGKQTDFLTYLGNVYCPQSADSVGNKNWQHNIHAMVKLN
jgi:hypothetical protein